MSSTRMTCCGKCGTQSTHLRRCTRCMTAWYCSVPCQTTDWPQHKKACLNKRTDDVTKCQTCSRTTGNLRRCTRCWSVWYCSQPCQAIDWPEHKTACKSHRTSDKVGDHTGATDQNIIDATTNAAGDSKNDKPTAYSKNDTPTASHPCAKCDTLGCTKKCSRCKETFYCSKSCQATHWSQHKRSCNKIYTEEERAIIEERQREKKDARERLARSNDAPFSFTYGNFLGGASRFLHMLSPEQALMHADRPPGSLFKAVIRAQQLFPLHDILTDFDMVADEPMFGFQAMMLSMRDPCVLVAFMFKYHEHVMRHGCYIKDQRDAESKVEFYLDFDNPWPFFTYDMVRPGNYVCLRNPVWHHFMDGTTGIRIDEACEVKVMDTTMLL